MTSLYIAYEDYLIGRTNSISNYFFYGAEPGEANEKIALELIKYVIEKLLRWSPTTAIKRFDSYMVKILKLERIILFIDYPIEVEKGSVEYILYLLYPNKVRMSQKDLAERIYRGILEEKKQFPREYFSGTIGFQRYFYCLRYLIVNYKVFYSTEEMYQFFSSPEGKKFLAKNRLKVPAAQLGIHVLDAVYHISKDNENSKFYYCYYRFLEKDAENCHN